MAPWQIDGQKRYVNCQSERERQQPTQQSRGFNNPNDYTATRQYEDLLYDIHENPNKEPTAMNGANRPLGNCTSGQMPYHSTLPHHSTHQLMGSVWFTKPIDHNSPEIRPLRVNNTNQVASEPPRYFQPPRKLGRAREIPPHLSNPQRGSYTFRDYSYKHNNKNTAEGSSSVEVYGRLPKFNDLERFATTLCLDLQL